MTDPQSFALAFMAIALGIGAWLYALERRSRRLQARLEELRRK